MKRNRYILVLSLLAVSFFFGCEKAEPLYKLDIPKGDSKIKQLELGASYENQVYMDLSSGNVVLNDYKVWDLALPSDVESLNIRINDANIAHITQSQYNDHFRKEAVPIAGWLIDGSCGTKDSCAIGDWYKDEAGVIVPKKLVYVLDRGESFTNKRYVRFEIASYTKERYILKCSDMDATDTFSIVVPIDSEKNYNYVNVETKEIINNEPIGKNDWDLVFKPYRHLFHDATPPMEYMVVGALINPNNAEVLKVTDMHYDSIGYEYGLSQTFETNWDVIGYDWKEYDRTSNKYEVDNTVTYLLKDTEGVMYKLRFLSFYNEFGEKGYPKMEYKTLD